MNLGALIAEVPYIACYVLTFSAFAAAGAWRDLRQESSGRNRRAAFWRVATPLIIGAILVAMIAVFFPVKAPPHDAEVPNASVNARKSLMQLAINATIVTPFVAWVLWRRQGPAALGVGKDDALRSLAIGACVSLVCIAMLGKLLVPLWSSTGTWWLFVSMLGVGVSEELIFRGFVLGSLAKRLPRKWAELGSAGIFSVVHVPQRIGSGMSPDEIAVSLLVLFIFGWCYAAAMRKGKNVPGLALVHAINNVCANS
jgi:membrane protease YdiL (CAAX protease family)